MERVNLTLIVPSFNEHANLNVLVDKYVRNEYSRQFNLLIVDNGSKDETSNFLKNTKTLGISSVRVEVNQGYGHGLLMGISHANTDYVGWIHADQESLLEIVVESHQSVLDDNCFIKGVRLSRPFSQKIFSNLMAVFCSLLLREKLYEINAQPSIYPKSFLVEQINPPKDFSIDLFFHYMAKKNRLNEIRVKVEFVDRLIGVSTWKKGLLSIVMMGSRTLAASWKMRNKKFLE
jgi:glycosyltransferase involved in cell wall biosynthesis